MKFAAGLPGNNHYPPSNFLPGQDHWEMHLTSADIQRIARATEDFGYDSITSSEHIVLPPDLAASMGAYYCDALTVMSFVAGGTQRLRVNSGVIVLPYHEPIAYAKAIATLDVLSSGRVTLTFGVGMARAEFAALGVPFERRGKVTDEYIAVLKELWTSDTPEFHGEFVDFADVVFEPKPVQRPHPPIWLGGSSMAALRRAARVGDGWSPAGSQGGKGPWMNSLADLPVFLAEARRVPGFEEREADFDISMAVLTSRIGPDHETLPPLESTPRTAQELIDRIAAMEQAGVTWTSIPRIDRPEAASLEDHLEFLEWGSKEVISAFR